MAANTAMVSGMMIARLGQTTLNTASARACSPVNGRGHGSALNTHGRIPVQSAISAEVASGTGQKPTPEKLS